MEIKETLIEIDDADESFNVIFIDASINSKAARFFGVEEEDCPAIVMHDHSNGKKYVKKNVKVADMKPFVAKWKVIHTIVPDTNNALLSLPGR